jgi:hypothetical protein
MQIITNRKGWITNRLKEPQFIKLDTKEKDFVINVSLSIAGQDKDTNEILLELAFLQALLKVAERRINKEVVHS